MRVADPRNRGPLWEEFTRAQNGQTISNLARAFHLPRPKTKIAILSMLAALTRSFDEQTLSRATLSRLIELLGKNAYEQVLETPTLMGATSTQVIGNEALTALTGHGEGSRIAAQAATDAEISPMIAEYLLPVVAALFMGALSAKTRPGLIAIMIGTEAAAQEPPAGGSLQLPVGRGSSGFFSGSTGVATGSGNPDRETLYRELSERIRDGDKAPSGADPLSAARRVVAESLGVRTRHAPWLARLQRLGTDALKNATEQTQLRLRTWRSRNPDQD